jgi:hypothetical protein
MSDEWETTKNGASQIREQSPGHLEIRCAKSQRPYTRTNELGMFCDAQPCQCEIESQSANEIMSKFLSQFSDQ